MTDIERIHYLIAKGEAVNAGQWARKVASKAFHEYYSLRVYANSLANVFVIDRTTHILDERLQLTI